MEEAKQLGGGCFQFSLASHAGSREVEAKEVGVSLINLLHEVPLSFGKWEPSAVSHFGAVALFLYSESHLVGM